ncbi:MAG: HEAT repeat domain-containing protein [Phycisphaeraceae bacterium]|nr:HEAT repeat domain-containing protein [Phycisphaeraceae bacterium]
MTSGQRSLLDRSGRALAGAAVSAALLCALAACGSLELRPGARSVFDFFRGPDVQDAAKWALDPYDADKRYRGTLALANEPYANDPVYIKLFMDNAADNDPGVRQASLRGLANHGGAVHVPIAVELLKDKDISVRIEAARTLQRLHNPVAVPALIEAMDPQKEPEAVVRAEVAAALGQYAQPRVVDRLISSLDDANLAVNRNTLTSLRILTGQNFGYDRGAWAKWNKEHQDLFLAGSVYTYQGYYRDKFWYEYLPFVPPPPNEPASTPAGFQPRP